MIDIHSTSDAATGRKFATDITDKRGYAARWSFSTRYIDHLLCQGMPHLKIGWRRVRIDIAEADLWMKERFGTQRRGVARRTGTAVGE
jgi:hypothetical protein